MPKVLVHTNKFLVIIYYTLLKFITVEQKLHSLPLQNLRTEAVLL